MRDFCDATSISSAARTALERGIPRDIPVVVGIDERRDVNPEVLKISIFLRINALPFQHPKEASAVVIVVALRDSHSVSRTVSARGVRSCTLR